MRAILRWQFFRYCCVGAVNTIVSISIMFGLAYMGVNYLLYTSLAYIVGIVVSFCLNLRLTFSSQGHVRRRFVRFILVNLLNLACVELVQFVLIELCHFPEELGVGIGMLSYVFIGFFANKRFVFCVLR